MAAAKLKLNCLNAALYRYRTIVIRALFGAPSTPPPISAWSNSWSAPITATVATK